MLTIGGFLSIFLCMNLVVAVAVDLRLDHCLR